MKIIVILLSLISFKCYAAEEEGILVATVDYPPLGIHKGSGTSGIGIDILREIAKRRKVKLREINIPISRIDEVAETLPAFYSILTKSAKRADKVNWLGKLTDDWNCFVTLKNKKPVSTIEEAKAIKALGTNTGGSGEAYLKNNGFTNLEGAAGLSANVRKLFGGVVEAVFASKFTYAYGVREAGKDPNDVVCSGEVNRHEHWAASTKKIPKQLFDDFSATYIELEKEGFIKKTVEQYK